MGERCLSKSRRMKISKQFQLWYLRSSNPKDIEVCYRYGVNGYILKPIDIKKLMRTLQFSLITGLNPSFFPMQQRVGYDRKSTDN